RRLVDRFATEICLAASAGRDVPDWVREALADVPERMAASDVLAAKVERACIDQVEAWVLAEQVGGEFSAVVLRADETKAGIPVWVMAASPTVPAALGSLRRLLTQAYDLEEPGWLVEAEELWRPVPPVRFRAVVPVWRKPWIVLGRDTFAGDVLRRVGVGNVY